MKKFLSVFTGFLSGIAVVLYLSQLFKFLVASIFISEQLNLIFEKIFLATTINFTYEHSTLTLFLIFLSPLILILIFIEISSFFLKKTGNNNFRAGLLVFQIVNVGYLIFSIFIGILNVIINFSFKSEWNLLFDQLKFSHNKELMFLLLALFILLIYINLFARRLRIYTPRIKHRK